jgi:3-oxoacyl-[acyl-carrier protein] reductase
MDLGLAGKVALLAASSKGLGFAAAEALAAEGARVVVNGRQQAVVDAAVEKLRQAGGEAAGVVADVTEADAAARLVGAAVERFGGLDILITNAGGPPSGAFDATPLESWERAFELTLMSAVRLIREALPYLRQSDAASILTITSISVKEPLPGLLLSNAIRPAVAGLTKTLSQELGGDGIRANSILPGWTRTERVDEIMAYRAQTNNSSVEAEIEKTIARNPLRRMGEPAEFGRVAAFLVSPAASYVNGVMLQVDGGSYAGLL